MIALAILAGMAMVGMILSLFARDRAETRWAMERMQLIDRAIARHVGEIRTLERLRNDNGTEPASEHPPHIDQIGL